MKGQVEQRIAKGDDVNIIAGHWQGVRGTVLRVFKRTDGITRIFVLSKGDVPRRCLVREHEVEKVKKYGIGQT